MDGHATHKLYREESGLGLKLAGTPFLMVDMPINACIDTIALPLKFVERQQYKTGGLEQHGGQISSP
jgi:uncharacterized protein YceK